VVVSAVGDLAAGATLELSPLQRRMYRRIERIAPLTSKQEK